jgi:hypothetical protein
MRLGRYTRLRTTGTCFVLCSPPCPCPTAAITVERLAPAGERVAERPGPSSSQVVGCWPASGIWKRGRVRSGTRSFPGGDLRVRWSWIPGRRCPLIHDPVPETVGHGLDPVVPQDEWFGIPGGPSDPRQTPPHASRLRSSPVPPSGWASRADFVLLRHGQRRRSRRGPSSELPPVRGRDENSHPHHRPQNHSQNPRPPRPESSLPSSSELSLGP